MTEYRIVATVDIDRNGEIFHYETSPCHFGGKPHNMKTYDKKKAEEWLERAKIECKKYDDFTAKKPYPDSYIFKQTNIRIQTREVTEWK